MGARLNVRDDELLALIDDPALRREGTAVALAEAFLARIERHRGRIDAVLTPMPEAALADARRADAARAARAPLPLDEAPGIRSASQGLRQRG